MYMQNPTHFATRAVQFPSETRTGEHQGGLAAETLVQTETGWRPARSLRRADRVQTFDGGWQAIVALDRFWIMPGPLARTLALPCGVLGNKAELALLPRQHLLIDTWDETALDGAVTALVPASALQGLGGVVWRSLTEPMEVVRPVFEDEEAILASGGMYLHCPAATVEPGRPPRPDFFHRLSDSRARPLLERRLAA